MADLTNEKLQNMLGAHEDGVYRLDARGEEFTLSVARQLLASLQENARLKSALREIAGQTLHNTNNRYEILLAKEALSNEVSNG